MLSGTLIFWSDVRALGYVETRTQEGSGFYLNKYFLSRSNIRFMTDEKPVVGSAVLFDVEQSRKPKAPNVYPLAVNAYVFREKGQAQFYLASLGAR
jgi:hypothetical protein